MTRRQYSDPFGSDDEEEMSPEEMNILNATEQRSPTKVNNSQNELSNNQVGNVKVI